MGSDNAPLVSQLPTITTAAARRIVAAAVAEAARGGEHVAAVVLDRRGTLLAAECSAAAPPASFDVARAKARHCIDFEKPTSHQDALLDNGVLQVLAVPGMLPLAGGLPVRQAGRLLGAVGVSGAASTRDEEIARVAAAEVGFEA